MLVFLDASSKCDKETSSVLVTDIRTRCDVNLRQIEAIGSQITDIIHRITVL